VILPDNSRPALSEAAIEAARAAVAQEHMLGENVVPLRLLNDVVIDADVEGEDGEASDDAVGR
jgi:hypothetical protein